MLDDRDILGPSGDRNGIGIMYAEKRDGLKEWRRTMDRRT